MKENSFRELRDEYQQEENFTRESLHTIENITSLQDLAPYHQKLVNHTKMLARSNQDFTEDIVQELYIKLDRYFKKYPDKVINGGFISLSLRNSLRNYWILLKRRSPDYDWANNDQEWEDNSEVIKEKLYDEELYEKLEEKINELEWYEKKLLQYSLEMPITELARRSGINYQNLVYSFSKVREKLGIAKQPYNKKTNN